MKLSPSHLAIVWVKLAELFGHTFTSQYGTAPNGSVAETWGTALAGLTGQQLAHGLREVVKLGSEWPPSAPRFRMLCLNIPTLASVSQEFKNTDGKNRSPFARKLWQFIDSYQFGRSDHDKADRMFRDAYELACEVVMNGGALDPAPVAVIENEKPAEIKPASEVVVKKHIAEILGTLTKTPVRPTVIDIQRQQDMASDRTFVCATLSDGSVVRPEPLPTCSAKHHEVLQAIEAEIDRVMGVEGEH